MSETLEIQDEEKKQRNIEKRLPSMLVSDPAQAELVEAIRAELERYQEEHTLAPPLVVKTTRRLLSGMLEVNAQVLERADILPGKEAYRIAVLTIDDYSDMFFDHRSIEDNIDDTHVIIGAFLRYLAGDKAHVSCCVLSGNIIIVFSLEDALTAGNISSQILHETVDIMELNYGLNIQIIMSWVITNPTGLPGAYKSMMDQYRFASSIRKPQDFVAIQSTGEESDFLADNLFVRQLSILINTLLAGRYDKVPSMVSSILEENVTSLHNDYSLAKSRMLCVGCILSEPVLAFKNDNFPSQAYASRFLKAESVDKLNQAASEIYAEMLHLDTLAEKEDTVDKACRYIRQNFSHPSLNVAAVCENVGISSQHLARLFQQKLGTTIAGYINDCRIRSAKELLVGTRLTVAEITEQVGYGSTDSFTRNFLKEEKLTPTEYRHMITNQPQG